MSRKSFVSSSITRQLHLLASVPTSDNPHILPVKHDKEVSLQHECTVTQWPHSFITASLGSWQVDRHYGSIVSASPLFSPLTCPFSATFGSLSDKESSWLIGVDIVISLTLLASKIWSQAYPSPNWLWNYRVPNVVTNSMICGHSQICIYM